MIPHFCLTSWACKKGQRDLSLAQKSDFLYISLGIAFPGDSAVKESTCNSGASGDVGSIPRLIPWRRAWQPISAFLPGELHGQRSLVAYSPGYKESDMTKVTQHTHIGIHLQFGNTLLFLLGWNNRKKINLFWLFASFWFSIFAGKGRYKSSKAILPYFMTREQLFFQPH